MLLECLANPSITSIVALSRRELDITNSKLDVYIMKDEDFLHYSDSSLTEKLKGAKAYIWSLGITLSKGTGNPRDRVISIDYTAAAAAAFQNAFLSGSSASRAPGDKFRFVYISGSGVERDQERPGKAPRKRNETSDVPFSMTLH
ncbi:uncharacterized protein N7458_001079 [Penicillium daleae]|uniref:Uncharacterized protein n=1 Tax=Penicillium daleae TaxID=63821 RepID=A0AAD6CCL3_9EURO|nr:uncharacterized protein N7458_001079 [Penicillium daleae]KAJ5459527.1 hypothetical protein N7458_001079 [Penicillium daleae]